MIEFMTIPFRRCLQQRLRFALCFFLLLCLLPFPAVRADDAPTIRIGYYANGDAMMRDSRGEYYGFNIEYLYEISKRTGWHYQFVECGSWNHAYDMLKNGDIDLVPGVYHTTAREKDMLYPTIPMSDMYSTLSVRRGDTRFAYEDFAAFEGMRVGVNTRAKDADDFRAYFAKHGIHATILSYETIEGMVDALKAGKIDGIAGTYLGRTSGLRTVARFAPSPVYLVASPHRPDLLMPLNRALEEMEISDPGLRARLYQKYFSVGTDERPVFTREELAYISQAQPLTALYDPDWRPLSYRDEDGEFRGIIADLFTQISMVSGLHFRYQPIANGDDAQRLLQAGQAQLICGRILDYRRDTRSDIESTRGYLSAPTALVYANRGRDNGTVAVTHENPFVPQLIAERGTARITYYHSDRECFEALRTGKADSAYVNSYAADYLLSSARYRRFTLSRLTSEAGEIGMGVDVDRNALLFSILEKCLEYVSSEQMNSLILKNTVETGNLSLDEVLYRYAPAIILFVVVGLGLIIAILGYALHSKTRAKRQIKTLLYRDNLTSLWNLNGFTECAQRALADAKPGQYALVYADINQFKTINDVFGFGEGDNLLCAFAHELREELCPVSGELAGRVSADQFVLLVRYTDFEQLSERLAHIDTRVNSYLRKRSSHYRAVFIFGVYVVNDPVGQDFSLLLDFANYARRSAKDTHRSVTVLYDEHMRLQELEHRDMSDRMEDALQSGQFVPFYQAKVDMHTGDIVGSEALVRWCDPERGLLPPGAFVPYFEVDRSIIELDLYIYEQVCYTIRRWIDEGMPVHPVSCNFSRLHFSNDETPNRLREIADRYRVPYPLIELEITETVALEDQERLIGYFQRLKEIGFRIALDDFGTGYSSLSLLQRMPVDVLKLDRSFLLHGLSGARELAIIRGIVCMASDLGIEIVCEGVETEGQSQALLAAGCRIAQGYRYARPVPVEEFEARLEETKQIV